MECPYCHGKHAPETSCIARPPIPMSYWPHSNEESEHSRGAEPAACDMCAD